MTADIHIHCSTKPALMHGEASIFEPQEFHVIPLIGADDFIGGDIVDSQSALDQQLDGDITLSINPLYALERNIGCMKSVQNLAKNPRIDRSVIDGLASGDRPAYTHVMDEFRRVATQAMADDRVNLIMEGNQTLLADRINLLSSIEGLHSLFINAAERRGQLGDIFFGRLQQTCRRIRPAYITLVHMQQNYLFSFCSGIKMSNQRQRDWFYPFDRGFEGLNDTGKRVLHLLSAEDVAIDLKHTSIANRLAIYDYLETEDLPAPIASHVGLTFMSAADYFAHRREGPITSISIDPRTACGSEEDHPATTRTLAYTIKRRQGPLRLMGNAAQINLFDEDLHYLLRRRGLIGLSLDQRILGATFAKNATKRQVDHVSPEDAKYISKHYNDLIERLGYPGEPVELSAFHKVNNVSEHPGLLQDLVELFRPTKLHLNYLAQSIIYIVRRGYEWGLPQPWRCIAFGSDFDGLINPINACTTASGYPRLKRQLIKILKQADRAKSMRDYLSARDGRTVEDMMEDIFAGNAVDFFAERMHLDAGALRPQT